MNPSNPSLWSTVETRHEPAKPDIRESYFERLGNLSAYKYPLKGAIKGPKGYENGFHQRGHNGDNGDIIEFAKQMGTTQQQISRLESTSYDDHSLSMLRRVAEALGATIHIELLRGKQKKSMGVAEDNPHYGRMK